MAEYDFECFCEKHWDEILADIAVLVSIPSVSQPSQAAAGAPYGPEARRALDAVVGIAQRMGLDARVDAGYVGICEVPGASDTLLGVIGHVDVVPDGPGWTVPPFALTKRDGYVLGRGVTDDKGPVVLALWALKYWADVYGVGADAGAGIAEANSAKPGVLPHPVRFIFGSSEENGMDDIVYYHAHYADPAFLFTPDAEFPVCYGEKGMFGAKLESPVLPEGERRIVALDCGTVPNAVPGTAYVVVRTDQGEQRFDFEGKTAHASTPEKGDSAMKPLIEYVLEHDLCSEAERRYLEAALIFAADFHGEACGIQASDEFFGSLTGVAGTLRLEGDRFVQTYDVRFPSSTDAARVEQAIRTRLQPFGDAVELTLVKSVEPFLIDPESAPVQALLGAFNEETGLDARAFTMGGATYAREFSRACSFGMEMPWVETPAWVGGMHGPNEGVAEEQLKLALRIYMRAFQRLFETQL